MSAKRRWISIVAAIGIAVGMLWAGTRPKRGDDPRPNVILLVIDTLRADHLHGYGYRRETSPNLDRLIDEGARFDAAIASSSWSAPSHTTIVTGVPTYRHTVLDFSDRIADGIDPLASLFHRSGYATGLFSSHYALHSGVGRIADGLDETVILKNEFDAEVLDRAFDWSRRRRRPFFLYMVLMGPHAPYLNYPESDDREYFTDLPPGGQRKYPFVDDWWTGVGGIPKSVQLEGRHDVGFYLNRYDRSIRHTDELVGDFLDRMRGSGLLENTLIVVTSDHGEGLGDHDYFSHEVHLYDFLIRVPLVVVSPGRIAPGVRVDSVVQHTDIAPTLLGLAGMEVPAWMEGRDLSAPLREDRPIDPDWIATSTYRLRGHERFAVRSARHKLIYDAVKQETEFYDLDQDPHEIRSLLADRDQSFPTEAYQELRSAAVELMRHHEGLAPQRRLDHLEPAVVEELRALGYVD